MAAYYDKDRLIEDASMLLVCEFLGEEYKRSGSNIFIRCPEHYARLGKEDSHISNCTISEKRYYCHACGANGSIIDFVKIKMGVDFNEALGIMGDSLGGRENYIISGNVQDKPKQVQILTADDYKLLDLNSNISLEYVNTISDDKKELNDDRLVPKVMTTGLFDFIHYLGLTKKMYSLNTLRDENELAYCYFIANRAKVKMNEYGKMMNTIDKKSSNSYKAILKSNDNKINKELLYDLKQTYMNWYNRCNEIYNIATSKMEDIQSVNEDLIQLSEENIEIPNYDLFL